jgi:4-carboxymuconolactone decarboxylase
MSADGSHDGERGRMKRGEETLRQIHGDLGVGFVEQLRAISPDFADMLVAFPFGDIYARPGLDLRARQIATIAALTVLGTSPHELGVHIRGALNVGCTRDEVLEVIMQMAVYGGFPAALSGLRTARATFDELDQG